MKLNLFAGPGPIGLDIGSCSIKAAQVMPGAGKPRLTCSLILPRSAPGEAFSAAEAMRLRQVLHRRGFRGREVVLCVPGKMVLTSILELPPPSSGAPLDEIARAEMARAHRQQADEIEVAFWELPQAPHPGEPGQVMAAACRHDHADSLIEPLRQAGLDVVALDLQSWAVARSLRPLLGDQTQLTATIDLGFGAATFVLLHQNLVVYERQLDGCGMAAMIEAVQRDHGLKGEVIEHLLDTVGFELTRCRRQEDRLLAEKIQGQLTNHFKALADEVRLSISYAAHQYPQARMDRLFLLGGGARVAGLSSMMSRWLELEVETVTVEQLVADDGLADGEGKSTALTVAVGLANFIEQEVAA